MEAQAAKVGPAGTAGRAGDQRGSHGGHRVAWSIAGKVGCGCKSVFSHKVAGRTKEGHEAGFRVAVVQAPAGVWHESFVSFVVLAFIFVRKSCVPAAPSLPGKPTTRRANAIAATQLGIDDFTACTEASRGMRAFASHDAGGWRHATQSLLPRRNSVENSVNSVRTPCLLCRGQRRTARLATMTVEPAVLRQPGNRPTRISHPTRHRLTYSETRRP